MQGKRDDGYYMTPYELSIFDSDEGVMDASTQTNDINSSVNTVV